MAKSPGLHIRVRICCGDSDGISIVPSGANLTFESRLQRGSSSNVKFKSSTRFNLLLVVISNPTFAHNGAAKGCKCRNRTTRVTVLLTKRFGPLPQPARPRSRTHLPHELPTSSRLASVVASVSMPARLRLRPVLSTCSGSTLRRALPIFLQASAGSCGGAGQRCLPL